MERPIDPGNEVSKPKPHTLEWVMDFVRRHPGATTQQGEASLLVAEIDQLRAENQELRVQTFIHNANSDTLK